MEILYMLIGGLMVFLSFYTGIKIGLKMVKGEPIKLDLPKRNKTSKAEKLMMEDVNTIFNFKDEE